MANIQTGTALDNIYANIIRLLKDGEEIPLTEHKGYTITIRDSWSDAFGIYNPSGELVQREHFWWNACCETVANANNLAEFPYDAWVEDEEYKYYREAMALQLSATGDMVDTICDGLRRMA